MSKGLSPYQKKLRKQIKDYCRDLSNYRTVLQDTNNRVNEVLNPQYNCMGYALGIYDWVDCYNFEYLEDQCSCENEDFDPMAPNCEEYELLEDMTYSVVDELVNRFPVRDIECPEDAEPHERVFAMRCGFDDFHFARLNSDGIWTHKPGGNTIRIMTEEELYGPAWCEHRYCPYTSTVYFFAIDASYDLEKEDDEED